MVLDPDEERLDPSRTGRLSEQRRGLFPLFLHDHHPLHSALTVHDISIAALLTKYGILCFERKIALRS
jgi:hypothetical protein